MKITIVSHDLGKNCFGRAHVLAKMCADFAEVEIVGASSTGQVWAPLRDDPLPVRLLPGRHGTVEQLMQHQPDLVYSVKARASSLGLALAARHRTAVPVVADVDDWELAFCYDEPLWWLRQCLDLRDPDNFWATYRAEKLVRRADAVTVSSSWLQHRFGGAVIAHARDADAYDPGLDATDLRTELDLNGRRVVLFMGSPRPHKGLTDVVAALDRLADDRITFLVVGAGDEVELPDRPWLQRIGNRPFHEVPAFLRLADVVVIAQRPTRTTKAQIPAKVFDAMAMGRPIVTTAVSDLPSIVGDSGIVVAPDSVSALAGGIAELLAEPWNAATLGAKARTRFEARFSYQAVRPVLREVIDSVLAPTSSTSSSEPAAAVHSMAERF